ncbi:MAG: NAD(P)/FAD-dependent oxidoreductase [Candidatus Bathyarchaeota archaeon]
MKYYSPPRNSGQTLKPPDLYEYFTDNYWFKTVDLENQVINEPLRGSHSADIVIVGGGYTGLSAAYHIRQRYPEKHIVLLEGACCGYGASGRNGGFCIGTDLIKKIDEDSDPDILQQNLDVSFYGLNFIKRMIAEYGVECDLEENGMLEVALSDKHIQKLEEFQSWLKSFGLDSTFHDGEELKAEIKSPRFIAGLDIPYGAILNPAKLARGMKRVVEEVGIEVRERTVVTRITPGKINHIDTELGDIRAPILVVALNAYAHKLGFFKNRVFPISVFQIATEPLNYSQLDSIGWSNRQGLSDMRTLFSYLVLTKDNRIVMGGSFAYYDNDALSSGNDKMLSQAITKDLFTSFPQLEGLQIEHAWGGTTAYTLDETSSVGVVGDHKNIYYGVGLSEGVPTTQTFGRIIADLMVGESNEFTNHSVVNHHVPYAGPRRLRGIFGRGAKWMWQKFG